MRAAMETQATSFTKAQMAEFKIAAMALMEWLRVNQPHPHITVIVDSESSEILEGQMRVRREDRTD
jgi:hypothetical protein